VPKKTPKPTRGVVTVGRGRKARNRLTDGAPDVRSIAKETELGDIKPRTGVPTRGIDPLHVVKLAASIHALGLIEPIAVDADGHLLAGGHRLAACRVLAASEGERVVALLDAARDLSPGAPAVDAAKEWTEPLFDLPAGPGELTPTRVPVRVFPMRSANDEERALAIEAAGNEPRRDYRPKEVRALYERLKAAGYHVGKGRPAKGAQPAMPRVAVVIGKSVRQVQRMLQDPRKNTTRVALNETKRRIALRKAALDYMKHHADEAPSQLRNAIEIMLAETDAQ